MPLASASFQPAGEEELELLLAPGTVTGFKGVQEVQSGYSCTTRRSRKLRNGRSFLSLRGLRLNFAFQVLLPNSALRPAATKNQVWSSIFSHFRGSIAVTRHISLFPRPERLDIEVQTAV